MSPPSSGRIRAVAKFFFEGECKFFVKGVTYGPFRPDADGHYLGSVEQANRDLLHMRELGINVAFAHPKVASSDDESRVLHSATVRIARRVNDC